MPEILFKQATVREISGARLGWKTPAIVIAASVLVALCAHITVPLGFTPVPVTMQTFAVLLIGLLFSPRVAFASLALYLAEGAAGLPVFSPHGIGGIAQLTGPTGGYLIAYPVAAALTSSLYRSARRHSFAGIMAASIGSIVILLMGAAWLGFLAKVPFSLVVHQSITPFLLGDALKVAAAAACASVFDSFRVD